MAGLRLHCARSRILPSALAVLLQAMLLVSAGSSSAQTSPGRQRQAGSPGARKPAPPPSQGTLAGWAGLNVISIQFKGVTAATLDPLPGQIAQRLGQPLDPEKVRDSLRQLYATGLYESIEVQGVRAGDEVSILFSGVPRLFFRRVQVNGVKNDRLRALFQSSAQIQAGSPYSQARLTESEDAVKQALEDNGYYQGKSSTSTSIDQANSLIDLHYDIQVGPRARVGGVNVQGSSGLSESEFRKKAKLKQGSAVSRTTVSRALKNLRKHYANSGRIASSVTLTSQSYSRPNNSLNFSFLAREGPKVSVQVEGAKIGKSEIQKLVPIYEEGAIDQDLLNEGAQNLRNYFQGKGYFDVRVTPEPERTEAGQVAVQFTVQLGAMHVVDSIMITGNRYFSTNIIEQRISVHPANLIDRHGVFSQQMLNRDVNNIKALYQSNGFSDIGVETKIVDRDVAHRVQKNLSHLQIVYAIHEGVQQRIGKYEITGISPAQIADLRPYLSAQVGQPYSAQNLDQDRDIATTYFSSKGYDNVETSLFQETEPNNPASMDVSMAITPGQQFFVRQVLISGQHFTRKSVIQDQVLLHPGDPLDQSALIDTQRNLYNLGLFNEVTAAAQNPDGAETYKNVLLNLTEARRWDINYGFGFEAQTGTPTQGCLSVSVQALLNVTNYKCNPNGQLGVSERLLFNVSRTNLRGTDQSITLRTNYGSLEQVANLVYQVPNFRHHPNLTFLLSGGYNSSAYISTYRAAVLSSSVRLSQGVDKANTLNYSFTYSRVSVDAATLQVSLADIPLYSEATRVGGPGLSWVRDTRDAPLDAHSGSFTSAEQFLSQGTFGSQVNFSRIDATNATYYNFGRDNWVFARQTRYGQERAFGNGAQQFVPLPERLYAGGPTSLRGFALNSAGPRDPQTGYPIGGAAVFVNSLELRTPPPYLPLVGQSIEFVLFHDMGNVFQKSSQVWPSALRTRQPHSQTCRNLSVPYTEYNTPTTCDFNDFSHALGVGVRYRTPVGPFRLDFSYNLNPPIYPVIYGYSSNSTGPGPYVGLAGHFNFFFSIGQSF